MSASRYSPFTTTATASTWCSLDAERIWGCSFHPELTNDDLDPTSAFVDACNCPIKK